MAKTKVEEPKPTPQVQAAERAAERLLLGPLNAAIDLVRRYQEVPGFRGYVKDRMVAVIPICAFMVLVSVCFAFATIMFLGGTRPVLVLLSMLLVPFVIIGSLFVQLYVFFSWLEIRALAKALHHSITPPGPIAKKLREAGFDLGDMPPVPWVLAVLFVFLPLLMLVSVTPLLGTLLILLLIAVPFVYARLDQ